MVFSLCLSVCLSQVEGKGNGIKTVVVNMVEIGKALNRPASCKFADILHYVILFGNSSE